MINTLACELQKNRRICHYISVNKIDHITKVGGGGLEIKKVSKSVTYYLIGLLRFENIKKLHMFQNVA